MPPARVVKKFSKQGQHQAKTIVLIKQLVFQESLAISFNWYQKLVVDMTWLEKAYLVKR